jgi:Glyoxalase/Bleomycin resistance protein/Dioxygenase superfamily
VAKYATNRSEDMSGSDPFYEIEQIGIVVRDLRETMEQYRRLLGWEPWDIYE